MFLIFGSSTSVMTVLRWIRLIRVITRGRVWRVIFSVLTTLFILLTFLSFRCQVWRWRRIWQIRWWRIRVWVHFRSVLFALQCWTMFWSSHFYSSRNIINIFALLDIFHFFLSIGVILNRLSISLIFSHSIFSRSNTLLVSKSESLINLRYANFSLIVSISPWVAAVSMSLSAGFQIPSLFAILVAKIRRLES